jgi:hypothetical protein
MVTIVFPQKSLDQRINIYAAAPAVRLGHICVALKRDGTKVPMRVPLKERACETDRFTYFQRRMRLQIVGGGHKARY